MTVKKIDILREYIFLYFEYIKNDVVTDSHFYFETLEKYIESLGLKIGRDNLKNRIVNSSNAYEFYTHLLLI